MSDGDKAPEKVHQGPVFRPLSEEERQLARFNERLEEQYRRKALERAIAEGRQEGVEQHTRELVGRLTGQGRSVAEIADILGIDVAEVEAIRHHPGS